MKISIAPTRPTVVFLGDTDHADFRDAAEMLRADASLVTPNASPELIIFAHSRPGAVDGRELECVRQSSPLAGVAVLAGSWCEGELRTGRPWPSVHRLYWYEFPGWWRRQLSLRTAGRCPHWCRPAAQLNHAVALPLAATAQRSGIILLNANAGTSEMLADALCLAGYSTVHATTEVARSFRGARAAIWDGGQLSREEERELSRFCAMLATERTPVVALLDFPRRDSVERVKEIGAVAILGKPWVNSHLLSTLESLTAPVALPAAA